jgi:hypothetical protein
MSYVINPYQVTPSGSWSEYESSSSATIPTNSNDGRITYDTTDEFYKCKMKVTLTTSWGSGNWNGTGGARNPYNVIDWGCSSGLPSNATWNIEIEYDGDASGGTCYWRKYDNGFSSAPTTTESWNMPSMRPMRYFILGGRWNGSISSSVSYRKFEWFA